MRTFRRVLSSINYLFPKLLTLDPSGAAAATMLVHGLLILAELLNWYVFYIPDWVFGAQMKVRTFALVIDWKKIDSRSGVQLGDDSQSSLGRKDPALFFFPRFLAKVTPAEHSHLSVLVVLCCIVVFFWHSNSVFENLGFSFPDIPVVEIVVLWLLSFSLQQCLPGDSAVQDIVWQGRLSFPKCSSPFLEPVRGGKGVGRTSLCQLPTSGCI